MTSGVDRVSNSQNSGNASTAVMIAPNMYTGLRPMRSVSAPYAGTAMNSHAEAIMIPVSATSRSMCECCVA